MTATSARPPARRSALIAAVLLALVLAQTLGLLHRLAHSAGWGAKPSTALQIEARQEAEAGHGLRGLFGGHDPDGGACDLYDQLTHADALWGAPAVVLPMPLPPAQAVRHPAWHLAAQSAGFLARGPPAIV